MLSIHKPVLLSEVIKYLNPQANQNFIDCTVGGGGHAEAILEATGPKGKLLGLDADPEAIDRAKEKLQKFSQRLTLVNDSYVNVKKITYDQRFNSIHGILLDLGLSSDQLQTSGRGFSFLALEPLDMRFDNINNSLTAMEIVNHWSESELVRIFKEYGEEQYAKQVAKEIVQSRKESEIKTTFDLVAIINKVIWSRKRINPSTKIFQALRMAVNSELDNVSKVLEDAVGLLESGGRLGIISFHSLEDRIIKQYFKKESVDCLCPPNIPVCRCGHKASLKLITKKPIVGTDKEIRLNPRARSAKLRVIEKL